MIPLRDLETIALGIVDGEPVDWSRVHESHPASPELDALRLIAAIATAHRVESVSPGSSHVAPGFGSRLTRDHRR